ncbi:MAG: SURF1 family protein [Nitrosomonas sp.]|nr:SURF1 family protein [Nitrosomonas sp.]
MTFFGYQFIPKLWATILVVVFVFIFVELGRWQLSRAEERSSRHESLERLSNEPVVTISGGLVKLEDVEYRQVEARGRYLPEYTIYLDNKTYQGHAGYHVITPLQIKNSKILLAINRGWISTGNDRSIIPEIETTGGEIIVQGVATSPEFKTFQIGESVFSGQVWSSFNLEHYQQMTGLALQPLMILQNSSAQDGLIRDWIKPDSGASKNIGYAVQWFSLAFITIIIFLILNVKRNNQKKQ